MSEGTTERDHTEALAMELTCPICLELYSEPVSLPCGHIYCLACLKTMGEGLDQHSCPECQESYRGTQALVKSTKMCNIVETYKAGKLCTVKPSDMVAMHSIGRSIMEEPNKEDHQIEATVGRHQGESLELKVGFQIASGSTDQPPSSQKLDKGKVEMLEPKLRLASQVTELSCRLEAAQSILRKEKDRETEMTTSNGQLREKASKLLGKIKDLSESYSAQVMQLINEELGAGEASVSSRVSQASELTEQLRQATLRAESLLTEDDATEFGNELQTLQPHIEELIAKPVGEEEEYIETKVNLAQACPKLEKISAELREKFGEIQRSLRNTLNPSEVTFDPETVHPNLILSEDLKTVTYSAVKQPYPASPQRFTTFYQVLSLQSFSEGNHCWEVELGGAPWIIGVCYSGKLTRSGMPSALESSQSSWCLMWLNNQLTAFEKSHSVPLMKATMARRLEIRLNFNTHSLSFYNISPISGKTHVYTFKMDLTEPVHLAYRMVSGLPKAHATICS